MIDALKGVNTVMANVNDNMDVSQIRDVLKEFSKQSEKMEMQQEMMSDQMDMAMDNGDMVDQAEEVYAQILGEIGMNLNDEMKAGKGNLNPAQAASQNNLEAVSSFDVTGFVELGLRPAIKARCFEESLIYSINLYY
jgi:charged multivesicular body protein 2A